MKLYLIVTTFLALVSDLRILFLWVWAFIFYLHLKSCLLGIRAYFWSLYFGPYVLFNYLFLFNWGNIDLWYHVKFRWKNITLCPLSLVYNNHVLLHSLYRFHLRWSDYHSTLLRNHLEIVFSKDTLKLMAFLLVTCKVFRFL